MTLPKAEERPPFQTWEQIARRLGRGDLSEAEPAEMWETLWLNESETVACLGWVREHARYPFAPALFSFAAYTGARCGEMLRSTPDDWDFESGLVAIREKKSNRSKSFTR